MRVKVMIPEEQVQQRIAELADELNQRYLDTPLHLVGVLKGSIFFLCELAKRLAMPVTLDFMRVSSYGDGTESTGQVKVLQDLSEEVAGRHVLLVEDIVDTGVTLEWMQQFFEARQPAEFVTCALLDKPSRRTRPVKADYVGFVVEDQFVVGCGLDYAQQYRNLPYIGILER